MQSVCAIHEGASGEPIGYVLEMTFFLPSLHRNLLVRLPNRLQHVADRA